MKKLFIILFLSVSTFIFAQGNFTTEWESPADWYAEDLLKLNSNSDVLSLICTKFLDSAVRIYNGSTHTLEYSWIGSLGTFQNYYSIFGTQFSKTSSHVAFYTTKFDVTGDGNNEIINANPSISLYHIIDPTNGNVIYTTNNFLWFLIDIDGDGYVELIENSTTGTKIISTPAQTVSISNQNEIVKDYNLKQNYPNPFNPTTTIEYNLNKGSDVKIIIYDILGKEVNTLVNQKQVPGVYKLNLNASELSTGTYFYSLIVDGVSESKKMILIK